MSGNNSPSYGSRHSIGDGGVSTDTLSAPNGKEVEEPLFAGEGVFENGGMIFGTRSVIHTAGPEFKDNVRAVLYPSGYVLLPLLDQPVEVHQTSGPALLVSDAGCACALTFITQMDRESVLIVSPDLLGETNELRQTFNNIKTCLAREYGVRTLRPSKYTAQVRSRCGRTVPAAATSTATTLTTSSPSFFKSYQDEWMLSILRRRCVLSQPFQRRGRCDQRRFFPSIVS